MIKVSVVIPAYNHASFLQKTIESVLAQTWRDYEIIVVDDGSQDATPAVAAQFGAALRYIRQANRGMAATRNTGIQAASGELISFLDDDDLWLPDYLATVVPHFQADPSLAAMYTGYQLTSGEEGRDFPKQGTRTVPANSLYDQLIEGGFFPPSSVSVRKSCLDSIGFFDENLQGYADWELWLRICKEHRFIGIPDVLIKYRIHSGGLSSNVEHMTEDHLKAVRKHFGLSQGEAAAWTVEKRRAYAFAYRTAAFEYSIRGQSDQAWEYIIRAAIIWPETLARLDTFYEFACGDQPRGYRGQAELLDIEANGAELLQRLDGLFAAGIPALAGYRHAACGSAYLALGMLSEQAGRWGSARRFYGQAIRENPRGTGFLCPRPPILEDASGPPVACHQALSGRPRTTKGGTRQLGHATSVSL